MKKYLHQPFFITSLLSLTILFLVLATYTFGWTTPSQAPPGGNLSAPINTSSSNQAKAGYLSVGTSTPPSFPLDVAGVLRIGRYSSAPSGSNGALYYNTATNKFQGYQSGAWADLGGGSLWTQTGSNIYYNTGNVGIGTTSPGAKLSIAGSIENIETPRYYRNVATYNGSASITGTLKITMPKSWSSTMMQVRIQGYDYSSNRGPWEVIVGGYNYSGGSWINYATSIKGSPPFTQVRLAHDGTYNVILLGNTSTTWLHEKVTVSEFIAGYSNITGWGTGWSISVITSEAGITSAVSPTIKTYVDNTGNVGIGTTSPGEKLEVAGNIKLSGASPTYKITNVATPTEASDVATKGYVDAGTSLLGFLCPSTIESSDRAAATLANAITTCRNLGNNYRLPTAEELSCFIGSAGVSSSYLWTRTPNYSSDYSWVVVRLTDGSWSDRGYYTNSYAFRCVH